MGSTRRAYLGTIAAAATTAGLAGCLGGDGNGSDGGGGGGDSDGGSTPTDAPEGTAGNGEDGPTVQVADHPELGELLVGPDGRTLYMFDSDEEGALESTCYDSCAENWPPLTVDGDPTAGEGVEAELATFEREDGETQVTAGGWPLYYFAADAEPGDVEGQGVNDVWWALAPDGTPIREGGEDEADGGGSAGDDGGGDAEDGGGGAEDGGGGGPY